MKSTDTTQDRPPAETSDRPTTTSAGVSAPTSDEAPGRTPTRLTERQHEEKPQLPRRSPVFLLRRTLREFSDDQGTDLAAALTYYAVLALFPALIALLSILGLVGQAGAAVTDIEDALRPLVSSSLLEQVHSVLTGLTTTPGAGIALAAGLLGALWAASGYVGAFARMMNRVYEVEEGRPAWKLRPVQLLITAVTTLLCAVGLVILVVSGPVAESVGRTLGVGSDLLTVWNIAKWPVLALVVMAVVALLYHLTPNVKFARFRVISAGAFLAIMVWLAASVGFAFYVANFGSYNQTYGSLAGVVIALVWLWLTNLALVLGAELDSETERARELRSGLPAEERLQLPVRDDRGIEKAEARRTRDQARQRELRLAAAGGGDPADRPFSRRR